MTSPQDDSEPSQSAQFYQDPFYQDHSSGVSGEEIAPGMYVAERYHLLRRLGMGGFGQTFLAEDTQPPAPAPCVVKQLRPTSQNPDFLKVARRLFERECATLQRLGLHDQIPALIDSFEWQGEFYLVQELVEGVSLGEELRSRGTLPPPEVITLLKDVLSVLTFIHHHQVIHRDIKPDNLIRRHRDGKFVLIDFGAVKELQTQPLPDSGPPITIGIGTQGYTPPEQLAGHPRYASDLYALGITATQALTGQVLSLWETDGELSPSHLPQPGAETGEPSGLRTVLSRMVQPSLPRRYATAQEVLVDLDRLDTLGGGDRPRVPYPETRLPFPGRQRWYRAGAIALMSSSLVLLLRFFGGFVPLEMNLYDRLSRSLASQEPDPRLLLIEITEADLQRLGHFPLEDHLLAEAIDILQTYQPRVVGLDMFRELPQGEGHEQLLRGLQAENVVGVMILGNTPAEMTPPPPTVSRDRTGFSDFAVDLDGKVRRNFLVATTHTNAQDEGGTLYFSFSLQMAQRYLAQSGIQAEGSQEDASILQLGNAQFRRLDPNFGGYRGINADGYQILLRYRSPEHIAPRTTLTAVLEKKLDPSLVKDKIVIIGTTAPSAKDNFFTPFSVQAQGNPALPGVVLHAQMTSQILGSVLDQQPLPWCWPDWLEGVWIVLSSCAGAGLIYLPWRWLGGVGLMGVGTGLVAVSTGGFVLGGWIPLAAPLTALGLSGLMGLALPSRPGLAVDQIGRRSWPRPRQS